MSDITDRIYALQNEISDLAVENEDRVPVLPDEIQTALREKVRGEAPIISLAKDVLHHASRQGEMPRLPEKAISVSDRGIYDLWRNTETRDSIETLLSDTGRADLIDVFGEYEEYERTKEARANERGNLVDAMRRLSDLLDAEISRYGYASSKGRRKTTSSPRGPKAKQGDVGAYHLRNPVTQYLHVSAERDWVLKNCRQGIATAGRDPAEFEGLEDEIYTYDEEGRILPA